MNKQKRVLYFLAIITATVVIFSGCSNTPTAPTQNVLRGWNKQTSNVTNRLFDAEFVDANNGFILVADSIYGYKLLKTNDGGTTWKLYNIPPGNNINAHFYINATTGWAVGLVILKTVDGGVTWSVYTLPAGSYLSHVYFSDPNNGIAFGMDGANNTVYKTNDGGSTWSQSSIPGWEYSLSAQFINANTGWVAGGIGTVPNNSGALAKTTDGGNSWTVSSITNSENLFNAYFADANTGWSYGWATGSVLQMWKSTDGGSAWNPVTVPGGITNLSSIKFANDLTGWAIGWNDNGGSATAQISKTIDGGGTWNSQVLPALQQNCELSSIFFIDANTGWVVGAESVTNFNSTNGLILKTENGGN